MSLPFTIFGSTSFDLSPFLIGTAFAAFPFDLVFFFAMLSSGVSVPEPRGSHRSGAIRPSGLYAAARESDSPTSIAARPSAAPNACSSLPRLPPDRACGVLRRGSIGAAHG